jgi:hypothetical protein
MRKTVFATMLLIVLIAGCTGGPKKGQTVDLSATPFIGGTAGLIADFVDFRADVFDGGRDPFDVVVKLENKGEYTVPASRARVKLSGVNPSQFGKLEEDLTKNAPDDLIGMTTDAQGNILPPTPVFIEFTGLNHFSPIAGAQVTFPFRADVCYTYATDAVSKLCVRENILAPEPEGICEINQDKPIFNSGAPVQVGAVKESARAKDKIGFSFEVANAGAGSVFERGSACDRSTRSKENRVYLVVDTGIPGLQCTGLTTTGTKAEGFTTLFEGKKIVSCTQTVTSRTDFEQQIGVQVIYDYEEFKQTEIRVKSSGEEAASPTGAVVAKVAQPVAEESPADEE